MMLNYSMGKVSIRSILKWNDCFRKSGERGVYNVKTFSSKTTTRRVPPPGIQRQRFEKPAIEPQKAPKLFIVAVALGVGTGTLSLLSAFDAGQSHCEPLEDIESLVTATEPVTGTKFPLVIDNGKYWLVSKSVRCMLNFCSLERARAYSYGLYFSSEATEACKEAKSPSDVAEKLLPFHICEAEADTARQEVGQAFIAAPSFQGAKKGYVFKTGSEGLGYYIDESGKLYEQVEMEISYPSIALRLIMLHDVEGKHIAHGFDKSLLGRIRKAQGSKETGSKGKEALRQLTRMLGVYNGGQWKKGTTLEFVRQPGGLVLVRVNGKESLSVRSEAFSWAVFDAYLGSQGHMGTVAKQDMLVRSREIIKLQNESNY